MAEYEFSCVDDAKEGLLQHELETNSRYSAYKASLGFGNASLNTAKKVFWEDQASVKFGRQEFSGIPFVVLGQKIFDCQCGKNRKEKRKARNKEKKTEEDHRCTKRKKISVQDTKKINCPARCVFRDICRFPSFQIQPENTSTPFERQQIAKDILARLVAGDDILSERVIIAHFPSIEQHTCHTLEEIPPEPIDPRLSKKIAEYVQSGVTKLHTMRTLLNNYVMDICSSYPHPTSKRFYPSDQCICQHMYRAKRGGRKDQETVIDMDSSNSHEKFASGTRVTLNARTVWVGTFKGTPIAPILLSEDGLNFFIKGVTGTHTFHLYPQEIQQCLFKFNGKPNLIFFLTTESCALRTRKDLGMDVNAALETPQLEHYYDPSGTDMQHQMITIVMERLPMEHRLDFQKYMELFKSWGKQADEAFCMELSKEEGDELYRQSTGVQIEQQAVAQASPNIGFVGPINANEELQAARWTCFVCHKRVENNSISSLESQERAGKSKLFVDSSYSIILRCQKCMLAFHAMCVQYKLEPILTGREDRVYCDHCANQV